MKANYKEVWNNGRQKKKEAIQYKQSVRALKTGQISLLGSANL